MRIEFLFMTTVGEIFKSARLKKGLDFTAIEKVTKIRAKFLLALENNEFEKLPPGTFARGFIKNYASFLGLPIEETLAFYRRAANEEKLIILPSPPLKIGRFSLTPQLFTSITISALILVFFVYLIFSYFKFAGSPTLLVNSPENNSVVHQGQVEIVGKTDPEAILTINGQTVGINENGSFDINVSLQPGLNSLTVVSTNKFNRQTTVTRNLRLEK